MTFIPSTISTFFKNKRILLRPLILYDLWKIQPLSPNNISYEEIPLNTGIHAHREHYYANTHSILE